MTAKKARKVVVEDGELQELRDDFEEFWLLCRRRVEKKKAWLQYIKSRKVAPKHEIHAGMISYTEATAHRDAELVKHPRTWLYGECWTDEHDSAPAAYRETWREMRLRHELQVTRDMGMTRH